MAVQGRTGTGRQTDRHTGTEAQRHLYEGSHTASSSSTATSCSRSSRTAGSCPAPTAQCRATLPTCWEGEKGSRHQLPAWPAPSPPPCLSSCRTAGLQGRRAFAGSGDKQAGLQPHSGPLLLLHMAAAERNVVKHHD